MTMIMKTPKVLLLLCVAIVAGCFCACDDDDTYADRVKRERRQIAAFLREGVQVKSSDSDTYLLDIPGNIKVISENEFYANDSTTNVEDNEYVLFKGSGVYMQIVRKGSGKKILSGQSATVICRYTEFNIASDTIQSTNQTLYYAAMPDIMNCANNLGLFTASFTSGVMRQRYSSSAVPEGWLIPLNFINLGRQDSSADGSAKVRIIVPSSRGHAEASYYTYPCFYEITYLRGR